MGCFSLDHSLPRIMRDPVRDPRSREGIEAGDPVEEGVDPPRAGRPEAVEEILPRSDAAAAGQVPERLGAVPGVLAVEAGDGPGSYRIAVSPGSDPREAIASLAVAEGWGLQELARQGATLEQIFLDAIARPAAAEAPA